MNFGKFNEIAELIGMVAIVASLIFVGLQLKQAGDIAQNELSLGIYTASIEINNEMNEHADIWVSGSRGDDLGEAEAVIFQGLMQNLNNQAFFARSMRLQLGGDEKLSVEIHNFARVLHDNPGARKAWMDYQSAYQPYRDLKQVPFETESFSDQVREALELMDEL